MDANPSPSSDSKSSDVKIPIPDQQKQGDEEQQQPPKRALFPWGRKSSPSDSSDQTAKPPSVPFIQLFKYATPHERGQAVTACISAIIHGGLLPIFTIIFGGIIDASADPSEPENTNDLVDRIGAQAKWFLVLAAGAFIASLIQVRLQIMVAQSVCARLRRKYFESIMSQDFTWYDSMDGGELTTRVASDVNLIQAGIGDKVTSAVQFASTFFVGIIIAFVYGPLLTLVVLSLSPLLIIGGAVFGQMAADSTGDGLGAYGAAGGIASEVIGLIRIVTAYNGQKEEIERYDKEVDKAFKSNMRKAVISGFFLGFTMLVMFCSYGIAFYFGATRILYANLSAGNVLTSFFAVIIACMSIGQAAPAFQSFAAARGAAPRIYEVIERPSEINPLDDSGDTIENFKGHVRFSSVDFRYRKLATNDGDDDDDKAPNDEERSYVLQKFTIDAPPGTTHALVGPSGCGKSTTVRLIERFYDVEGGSVTLDDVDVRSLNVRWLRSQIGYVGQMPTLFMLTIRENIALGAPMELTTEKGSGNVWKRKELTEAEIIDAAKQANAHDFIMKLPEQYDTLLGERGALLSGGQKQRICIARALARNPRILILDESTASLDAQSERVVQEALEAASAGRTTITIAHRLSTVRNADVISVLDQGHVVESGTHNGLIANENGPYFKLVENQNIKALKADKAATTEAVGEADVLKGSVTSTKKSGGKAAAEEDDTDAEARDKADAVAKGIFSRVYKYNAREIPYMLIGMIGAMAAGAALPISAILFSDAIVEMLRNNMSLAEVRRYALYYVALGAGCLVGNFLQVAMVTLSGERLTRTLRKQSFRALLRQDMGYFDEKENALGAVTTRLATDASLVQGVTGGSLGAMGYVIGTILTGFLVSYIACWKTALVVTAMFPLIAFSGAVQIKLMTGFDADSDKKYMAAGAIASEAVDNLETVTSVGVQDVFIDRYNHELEIPLRNGRRSALIAGIAFGISEFMAFALWAVAFWVGSVFVEERAGTCDLAGLFKAITGLMFAGMMLGNVTMFLPDVTKSRIAATRIFRLLDRVSTVDPSTDDGGRCNIEGDVQLKDVEFEYPTRTDVAVLRKLNVCIGRGQTLALVGASGCGKSTVVALLERFYDPRSGEIILDGSVPLTSLNVRSTRSQMGLVSQEPDLFNRSVRDNITYGLSAEDGMVVTDSMIEKAARDANAHDFIKDLPGKYDFVVGPRGNRLSGGQRQRIAIARAIIREPRVLLLDEATSALDSNSERLVQDALDRVGEGRTTIAIAHRLSTVKDADAIAVVKRGKIVEVGTHEQLLRVENGEYATLVKNQLSGTEEEEAGNENK